MALFEVIFSPTGGTRRAADSLIQGLDGQAEIIDLAEPGSGGRDAFALDDLAVIAVPSFGGRVPALAAERVAALRGNGCAAVLMCVYGNRAYDDTLCELQDIAQKAGFRPVAAVAAVAEHSIAHQFASGRPGSGDLAQLRQFGEEIQRSIPDGGIGHLELPGRIPVQPAKQTGMIPKAGRNCSQCGQCAEQCPAGAIEAANPRRTDKARCISCMRCTAVCPQQARKLNPMLVGAAGLMLRKACSVRKENELFLP